MTYQYHAFDLNIHSGIEIPELIRFQGEPDVTIRLGKVADRLENPKKEGVRFQASPGMFFLRVDNIAKYLAINGNTIIIEPFQGVDIQDVRLFTLGSVLGALIHQRGMLPLHASAIKVNGVCVAFCGVSGNGKSTLAKEFVNRGYDLHADDICAVSIADNGQPIVFPAYPQFKLWEDAMEKTGVDLASSSRVRKVLDKYSVPATAEFSHAPLPLHKIYILAPYNKKEFKKTLVTGMDKFNALKNHTFRFNFIEGLGQEAAHFKTVGALAKRVPLTRVLRPKKPYMLKELADLLEMDFNKEDNSPADND